MAEEPTTYPVVEALMRRSRLPWYWATAMVAVVLLLLLILAVLLDDTIIDLLGWGFWRDYGSGLFLIAYLLMAYPFRLTFRHDSWSLR